MFIVWIQAKIGGDVECTDLEEKLKEILIIWTKKKNRVIVYWIDSENKIKIDFDCIVTSCVSGKRKKRGQIKNASLEKRWKGLKNRTMDRLR